jgi:PAS domain S-box-containing protein
VADGISADEIVRLAVEACPSGMIMIDSAGKIVLVNAEVERLFGYRRDELIGNSIDMLVPESMRAAHGGHRACFVDKPETRRMGVGRDLYGTRKDGTEFPVEIGLNPIQTGDGLLIMSAITDLTERKAAEEQFRRVVENSPIGKIMTDAKGTIVLINAETERLLGYGREELIGKPIEMLVPPRIQAEHVRFRGAFHQHPQARSMGSGRDLHVVRKDGTELQVEIGLNPIQTRAGTMVLTAIVDISERNKAMQALAEQREELQRSNADLEQFAYVASHDLQEPLRMVATYAALLAERYQGKLDERADKYIGYTIDGAKRMQQLIKELLDYSRVSSNAKVPVVVRTDVIVENVISGLQVAIAESGAELVCDPLPAVRADQAQLGQVFQNLIGNAIKFRAERAPRIHIGADKSNGKCVFRIEDNGIGIDKQYSDRVFQMFQRLHERGRYEGSGIGLAIAKKIVERHGGRIWFDSEPDKGTTFFFTMPSA